MIYRKMDRYDTDPFYDLSFLFFSQAAATKEKRMIAICTAVENMNWGEPGSDTLVPMNENITAEGMTPSTLPKR